MQRTPLAIATLALLLAIGLTVVPGAVATHEPIPDPFQVCPYGYGCDDGYHAALWYWLTHTPYPLPEPCLPTSQPACM